MSRSASRKIFKMHADEVASNLNRALAMIEHAKNSVVGDSASHPNIELLCS